MHRNRAGCPVQHARVDSYVGAVFLFRQVLSRLSLDYGVEMPVEVFYLWWNSRQKWGCATPRDDDFVHAINYESQFWCRYMTGSGASLLGGASRHRLVSQDNEPNGFLTWVQFPLPATAPRVARIPSTFESFQALFRWSLLVDSGSDFIWTVK